MRSMLWLAVVVTVIGCSFGDAPAPPAFTAQVTLDGKPIDGVTILVVPPDAGTASIAVGTSDLSGKAVIEANPGSVAKPGKYTILLVRWLPRPNTKAGTAKPGVLETPAGMTNTLPERYADSYNTPFKAVDIGPKLELPPLELKSKL